MSTWGAATSQWLHRQAKNRGSKLLDTVWQTVTPIPVIAGDATTTPQASGDRPKRDAEQFACRRFPLMPPEKNLRTWRGSTSPRTPPLRSISRSPFVRNVAPTNNSEDEVGMLDTEQMSHAQAKHPSGAVPRPGSDSFRVEGAFVVL